MTAHRERLVLNSEHAKDIAYRRTYTLYVWDQERPTWPSQYTHESIITEVLPRDFDF